MSDNSKRDRKAMTISLVVHGVLAILFIFILAWREPDPPIPEYGIELNLGVLDPGSGSIQRETPPAQVDKPTPDEPIDETSTEAMETSTTESTDQIEEIESETNTEDSEAEVSDEPVEETPEEIVEDPVEEVIEEPVEEPVENIETFEPESPDFQEPEPTEETAPEVVEEFPVEEPEEVIAEEPVTEEIIEEPEEETNNQEVEAPTSEESNLEGDAIDSVDPSSTNQGTEEDEVGDEGDPEGDIDARALYGTPGAADGAALELSGWDWDYLPKPNDTSDENGRIVFQITIDDAGYIIGIKTLEKTVTPAVEKIYRDEVLRLTFSPTSDNSRPAPTSTGRITFIIKTN